MQLNVIIGLCQTTKTKKSSRSYVLMKSWEAVVCMIISGTFLQTYNLIRDFLSIHAFKGLVSTIYSHSHFIAKQNIKIIGFISERNDRTRYSVYWISNILYNNQKETRYVFNIILFISINNLFLQQGHVSWENEFDIRIVVYQ